MAFPPAPIERELYMWIQKIFKIDIEDKQEYVLQVHWNVYGNAKQVESGINTLGIN